MNLYWASDYDGFEDWFIVANSEEEASQVHEDFEGFAESSAIAEFVCSISDELIIKYELTEPKWPSHELIEELGGKFVHERSPRRVNFNGKIYSEGEVAESIFLDSIINEDEGVYVINIQNTDRYKIGKTIDLKRRLKQFSTGNPENIKIVYFVATKHYHSLEKHLHSMFFEYTIGGEWFKFDANSLEDLKLNLWYLEHKSSNNFRFYDVKSISTQAGTF